MMNTKNGGARIDTEQLLATGAMSGPHRKTKPVTRPWWQRLLRRLDAWELARKGKQ